MTTGKLREAGVSLPVIRRQPPSQQPDSHPGRGGFARFDQPCISCHSRASYVPDRRTASRSAECPISRRSAQPQQRQEAEGRGQRHNCSRAEFTALCISKLAATPSCAPRTQAVAQDSTTDSTTALGTRRAEETALKLNPTSAIRLEICASEKSVSLIRRQTPTSSPKTSVLTITH